MKLLLWICAGFLFIRLIYLPIGYYTLLSILVTIGSITVVVTGYKKGFNFWVISFGLIAIIFNPLYQLSLKTNQFRCLLILLSE